MIKRQIIFNIIVRSYIVITIKKINFVIYKFSIKLKFKNYLIQKIKIL